MTSGRGPHLKVLGAVLLGCFLLQTAWTLAVPTFRGIDEYEHVYKAAAVARGDWSPHHRPSPTLWGEVVVVPADLVDAARPTCETLPDTDCDALGPAGAGQVEMPTSAGRYNPLFYFVVGTVARPFSGDAALYVMRTTAGLMCACLVALSALTLRRWSRTAWPAATLLLACTPMFTYSTMVASPNGIEMAGALLVWSAVLGLARPSVSSRDLRLFIVMATVGAVPLLVVRSLGPLWLLLICVCVLPLLTRAHLRRLTETPLLRRCAAGLSVLAVAAAAYTWWAGTNAIGDGPKSFGVPSIGDLTGQWVLWFIQTVGTIPARDELAPLPLYALAFLTWWVVTWATLRQADGRARAALLSVFVLAGAVPLAVTIASYDAAGAVWQGRYTLPLTIGFALLCGRVMDTHSSTRTANRVMAVMALLFAVFHAVAILSVHARLQDQGVLAGTRLADLSVPLVAALVVAGSMVMTAGLRIGPRSPAASPASLAEQGAHGS